MEQSIIYLSACVMIGLGGLGAAIGTGLLDLRLLKNPSLDTPPMTDCRFCLILLAIGFIPLVTLEVGLYLIFVVAPDS
jgi:F-type H+-transporting ATPase subunit c